VTARSPLNQTLWGEIATLLGTLIVVAGAGLAWGSSDTPKLPIGAVPVYVSPSAALRSGFAVKIGWISVGWLVVTLGVICACLLLFNPSEKEKPLFLRSHLALAIAILVIAVLHFGPYAGVVLSALGGCFLIASALMRYRERS